MLKKFNHVEQLIEECKFKDALQLINEIEEKKGLTPQQQLSTYLLKSSLLLEFQNFKKALKYSEKSYQLSQELKDNLHLLDTHIIQIEIFTNFRKFKSVVDLLLKCESLLKQIAQEVSVEYNKRKAKFFHKKGLYLYCIGDLDLSLKFYNQALKLAKEINNKYIICKCLNSLGVIYLTKGEIDLSLDYFEQSLNTAKEINYKRRILGTLDNIGILYHQKGDLERASKYTKESLVLSEELGLTFTTVLILYSLIELAIDKGDITEVKYYLERMKQIFEEQKIISIDSVYRLSRAVILKATGDTRNRGKAEEILTQLLNEDILEYQHKEIALLNLCDLLLIEIQRSNNIELLVEVQSYISDLSNYAKKNYSYPLLAETYLLQGRTALITLDLNEARKYLTQAQQIAEKYNLNRLAIRISNEHDDLLNQLSRWEDLKISEVTLSERIKLARLDDQVKHMIQKSTIETTKLNFEVPVLLLIIAEGGLPAFSNSFTSQFSVKDEVISSFLTAINSFSDELFSEGLDRAKFGEYMVLINSVGTFLICYLFKGQSYIAKQRLNYFAEHMRDSATIWHSFNNFYKNNMALTLEANPALEDLFIETFIKNDRWS